MPRPGRTVSRRSRRACLPRGESLDSLYRRMVDENLVRRDISFAEMGMLVLNYMEDHPAEGDDAHGVTERLYSSANRQKRSHIRTFVRLMQDIGHALRHPEAIPRALGSDLVRKFEEDEGLAGVVAAQLNFLPEGASPEDELAVLRAALDNRPPPPVRTPPRSKAVGKTTLKLARPEGVAKCTAPTARWSCASPAISRRSTGRGSRTRSRRSSTRWTARPRGLWGRRPRQLPRRIWRKMKLGAVLSSH